MEVILNCALLTERSAAHAYLKEQFSFPDYYGCNLDALYDCLMELTDCQIILQDPGILYNGGYGEALLGTLRDAARDNPSLGLSAGNLN